jgi:basic amino acid/polyamine antiporter, APA family
VSTPALDRRLGLRDAVVLGLGSMIGAGVFAAFAPAAAAAGQALLIALVVAALVAHANATSSARLASMYPQSGGAYVYGRERLGPFWGYLAGWGFVVGKTASCAAMALTIGAYAVPQQQRLVAAAAVLAVTALNVTGVQRSAVATRIIVAFVLVVLGAVVVASLSQGSTGTRVLVSFSGATAWGVLQGAGFLFFAFAGYARIATLGEEVTEPSRTIPRAITTALAIALLVYASVAIALLTLLGPDGTAKAAAPVAAAAAAVGTGWLEPLVRLAAVVAALGSLLSLLLGVSRTTLAMARDGHLPHTLAAVHPRFRGPHHAEITVGAVVLVVVLLVDVRSAIGFSSLAVLVYYAIANASALTVRGSRWSTAVAVFGLGGCLALAATLPLPSVVAGIAVLTLGAVVFGARGTARTTS